MGDGSALQPMRRRLHSFVFASVLVIVLAAGAALLGSGAGAADKSSNKPVTITTLTGSGSTEDAPQNQPNANVEYPILLNGSDSFTFTQPAGSVAQLVVTETDGEVHWSNPEYPAAFCEGTVYVFDDSAPLGARLDLVDQRGDHVGFPGYRTTINALAAPDANRTVTLRAIVRENDGCDEVNDNEPVADDDWWTVSIRVSLVILRG